MKNIIDRLPKPISELFDKVKEAGGELWLYGETLADLCFTETLPVHYQLATSLRQDKLIETLDIAVSDINPKWPEIVLYYQRGKFHALTVDFLPESLDEAYYIEIRPYEEDFLSGLTNLPFSIDRLAWDSNTLYHHIGVEQDFRNKAISLSQQSQSNTSKNLLDLFRLARYVIKYDLIRTEPVHPSVEKKKYKKMPGPYGWRKEFTKLLELPQPSKCFEYLREWGILSHFFDELLEGYGVTQNEFHEYDVYNHSLVACDSALKEEPLIRMGALFHDIGKPRSKRLIVKEASQSSKNVFYDHENIGSRMTYQILKKFGFSHDTVITVSKLVRLHMFHYTTEWTDSAVRRLIRKANIDLPNLFKLRKADRLGSGKKGAESKAIQRLEKRIKHIQEIESRMTVKDLAVDGHDMMKHFGLSPGPVIGQLLNYLLTIVETDSGKNQRDVLLSYADNWLREAKVS